MINCFRKEVPVNIFPLLYRFVSFEKMARMTHGPRTLLLGDSFVSRLSNVRGVVLEVTGTRAYFHGEPGTTVRGLLRELDRRMDRMYRDGLPFPYEVVVASIGGNDFCDAHLTCERFVWDLANLAQTLTTRFGVSKVILCQILHAHGSIHGT
jgi:hypothetical protein